MARMTWSGILNTVVNVGVIAFAVFLLVRPDGVVAKSSRNVETHGRFSERLANPGVT